MSRRNRHRAGQSFTTSSGRLIALGLLLIIGVDWDIGRRSVRLVFGNFAGLVDPGLGLIVGAVLTGVLCDLFEHHLLFARRPSDADLVAILDPPREQF